MPDNEPTAPASLPSYRRQDGVVTLLDVLGWKGIYRRQTDPLQTLETLFGSLSAAADKYRGKNATPEIKSISDTILIATSAVPASDLGDAISKHGELCSLAICESLKLGIPVRGATSVGQFAANDRSYVGEAIDEAASWHEQADWVGVNLTPSALLRLPDPVEWWCKYAPPIKGQDKSETHCVNWVGRWTDEHDTKAIDQLRNALLSLGPILPEFANKILNTLAFYGVRTSSAKGLPQHRRSIGPFPRR